MKYTVKWLKEHLEEMRQNEDLSSKPFNILTIVICTLVAIPYVLYVKSMMVLDVADGEGEQAGVEDCCAGLVFLETRVRPPLTLGWVREVHCHC